MSNREIAIDLIQKLPENASLHEIAQEIEFIAGVREGFEQLECGECGSRKGTGDGTFMDRKVILSPRAIQDLGEIVRYISFDNPQAAERLGYALIDASLSLKNLPERGHFVPGFADGRRLPPGVASKIAIG